MHLKNKSRETRANSRQQHTPASKTNILNLPSGTTSLSSSQWIRLQDMGLNTEESNKEWKDMLSLALITFLLIIYLIHGQVVRPFKIFSTLE